MMSPASVATAAPMTKATHGEPFNRVAISAVE